MTASIQRDTWPCHQKTLKDTTTVQSRGKLMERSIRSIIFKFYSCIFSIIFIHATRDHIGRSYAVSLLLNTHYEYMMRWLPRIIFITQVQRRPIAFERNSCLYTFTFSRSYKSAVQLLPIL
jgi:hypothetical protein